MLKARVAPCDAGSLSAAARRTYRSARFVVCAAAVRASQRVAASLDRRRPRLQRRRRAAHARVDARHLHPLVAGDPRARRSCTRAHASLE
eukprot:6189309-Pleurochrysis_carterae.AAC.1